MSFATKQRAIGEVESGPVFVEQIHMGPPFEQQDFRASRVKRFSCRFSLCCLFKVSFLVIFVWLGTVLWMIRFAN